MVVKVVVDDKTLRMGIINAAVFPVPVGAQANISLLINSEGMACICIAVGSLYLDASIFLRMTFVLM